jgi:hypothetical protein
MTSGSEAHALPEASSGRRYGLAGVTTSPASRRSNFFNQTRRSHMNFGDAPLRAPPTSRVHVLAFVAFGRTVGRASSHIASVPRATGSV